MTGHRLVNVRTFWYVSVPSYTNMAAVRTSDVTWVNLSLTLTTIPWRNMGEWKYSSTRS